MVHTTKPTNYEVGDGNKDHTIEEAHKGLGIWQSPCGGGIPKIRALQQHHGNQARSYIWGMCPTHGLYYTHHEA
jgi:hypothetical protein